MSIRHDPLLVGDRVRDTRGRHGTIRAVQLVDTGVVNVEFDADPPGTIRRVRTISLYRATSRSERKARS